MYILIFINSNLNFNRISTSNLIQIPMLLTIHFFKSFTGASVNSATNPNNVGPPSSNSQNNSGSFPPNSSSSDQQMSDQMVW